MTVKLNCLADVCLIPIGTGKVSVSDEVTVITRLARESHLECTLHSAGTTIEGPWDEVMDLIGQMHQILHEKGVVRIQSDIRVGTRTDKKQKPQDKIDIVESKFKQLK
ncbi:Piso0_002266 [Millerozyma farinosa CBS 7064]|uniref:Piso0_002266 protein n=1 Tax=Pichia sorbitophila (strain ATCC MYA-4447 / BCRC 22081 / CBS 7064 / NBRC 10061 / NRRL Y-12695) TaxID=559304 RepID=G8YC55_PICSO|nr:Piso0_002266 [Millerozyma farinosa CBS 7064]